MTSIKVCSGRGSTTRSSAWPRARPRRGPKDLRTIPARLQYSGRSALMRIVSTNGSITSAPQAEQALDRLVPHRVVVVAKAFEPALHLLATTVRMFGAGLAAKTHPRARARFPIGPSQSRRTMLRCWFKRSARNNEKAATRTSQSSFRVEQDVQYTADRAVLTTGILLDEPVHRRRYARLFAFLSRVHRSSAATESGDGNRAKQRAAISRIRAFRSSNMAISDSRVHADRQLRPIGA